MEASLDGRHGTSYEFYDPYCDSCYEDGGQNVRAFGFCKDCVQFLCTACRSVHGRLQATRHHNVVHGEDMPKSQADKPPRFDSCDVHPKLLKDMFCCVHKILLCSICSSTKHNSCSIKNVEDISNMIDVSDTRALYDRIRSLQETLKSTLATVDKAMMELKDQEKTMLHDAQKVYDQIIAQANKLFGSIKNEIQASCQSQISVLSQRRKNVSDMLLKLDSPLTILAEVKAKPIDTKVFLRLQENVSFTKKVVNELQALLKSLKFILFSFMQSRPSQEFLSPSFTLGKIRESESNPSGVDVTVPKMMFLVSALKKTTVTAQPKASQTPRPQNLKGAVTKPLPKIKATKQNECSTKVTGDRFVCHITSMATTKDNRIIIADYNNHKIKIYSHNLKFLTFVVAPLRPRFIAVISDKEAVITCCVNKSLVILDISGRRPRIKTTTQLSYDVCGISRYGNKLVVTSPGSKPPCVKLIDQTGRVYWSVSTDQQGQPLFTEPMYVSSPGDGRSSTVIVTDEGNDTLTLLNGDTGEVIARRQLKEEKGPRGVTIDTAGNVYVCFSENSEVAVLSGDLSEEKILLSNQNGLSSIPHAIAYDHMTHQLVISYSPYSFLGSNQIVSFKLS